MWLYERQYFDALDFEYRQGNGWRPSKLYARTLYLAEGEQVLWMDDGSSWLGFGSYKWVKALTNFRVFYYDFKAHQCSSLSLPMVESVVVTNKRRETRSDHQGEMQTREGLLGPFSQTRGLHAVRERQCWRRAFHARRQALCHNPRHRGPRRHAQMARSAIEQATKNTRMAGKAEEEKPATTLPSQPQGVQCKKCQSYNPEDAAYCNKCGAKMSFVCGKCKHENPDGAKFCNQCGQPL